MLSAIVHARGSGLRKWLTVQHIPCWRKLVPHELNVLALENPRLFYDLLFAASAQTLLEIASDPKHLGGDIGVIAILHTWGQNLLRIPTFTVSFPPADSRWTIVAGSARATLSSYR